MSAVRAKPLVYASQTARRDAARLLRRGLMIELEVERAIIAGHVTAGNAGFVFLDDHKLVARVERRPGHLRPRPRSWLVTGVDRNLKIRGDRSRATGSSAPRPGPR
jgi:hypothetical protein